MAFPSVASIFGRGQPQQPQQPAPQPQQGGQQPSPMAQNNPGADPSNSPQPSSSPLDAFKDIWSNNNNGNGDPNADPFASPLFGTDPAKIVEAAKKADFMSQLPAELVQRAMSGSDPQAFMDVINQVAQNSLALSLQLSTVTVEQAGTRIGDRFKKATPGMVKDVQLSGMRSENPVLQNPAAEPMLRMIRDRIRNQDPSLSPQEIQAKAEDYLTTFAGELTGSKAPQTSNSGEEQDWMRWSNT